MLTHPQEIQKKKMTEETSTPATPNQAPIPTPNPMIEYSDFQKLDLRVATITSAEAVAKTDRLVHLKLDIGEDGLRDVVAGIREFYSPEDLLNKQVVYLANLAPRKLRGIMSTGMILAAAVCKDTAVTDLSLILPDKQLPAGSEVG